jgi:ABC-2 type transport system permease protein
VSVVQDVAPVAEVPATVPPGRQITGPTALGDDPARLWRLAYTLAATDFKLKFFGSFLGYVWQLMNPLLLFGVLFLVFSVGLKLDGGVHYFPEGLLLGIVLYSFFNEATSTAVRSLMQRENLVRKVDFPRLAVPLASVMASVFNLGLNLIPVLVFLVASGGTPQVSWLGSVLVVAVLVLFAFGMSMVLSVSFVRFRDIEPIWSVVLQVMFYSSFVFFTVDSVGNHKHGQLWVDIMMSNPFAAVLAAGRHLFIDASWEAPWQAMSSPWLVAIPGGLIVASVVFGFLLFRAQAPLIAEDL